MKRDFRIFPYIHAQVSAKIQTFVSLIFSWVEHLEVTFPPPGDEWLFHIGSYNFVEIGNSERLY